MEETFLLFHLFYSLHDTGKLGNLLHNLCFYS
jgi:hypothetical protein